MLPLHLSYTFAMFSTNWQALADLNINLGKCKKKDFSVAAILQTNTHLKPTARTLAPQKEMSSNDKKRQNELLANAQECAILNNILYHNEFASIINSPKKSTMSSSSSSKSAPTSSLSPPSLTFPELSMSPVKEMLHESGDMESPTVRILANKTRTRRNSKAFGTLLHCPKCGKCFNRNWLLKGHLRTHTGEKPFQCELCLRRFADNSNLRAHKQTHSDIKKFECGNCHRKFALKSYLSKHKESACGKYRRKF